MYHVPRRRHYHSGRSDGVVFRATPVGQAAHRFAADGVPGATFECRAPASRRRDAGRASLVCHTFHPWRRVSAGACPLARVGVARGQQDTSEPAQARSCRGTAPSAGGRPFRCPAQEHPRRFAISFILCKYTTTLICRQGRPRTTARSRAGRNGSLTSCDKRLATLLLWQVIAVMVMVLDIASHS